VGNFEDSPAVCMRSWSKPTTNRVVEGLFLAACCRCSSRRFTAPSPRVNSTLRCFNCKWQRQRQTETETETETEKDEIDVGFRRRHGERGTVTGTPGIEDSLIFSASVTGKLKKT